MVPSGPLGTWRAEGVLLTALSLVLVLSAAAPPRAPAEPPAPAEARVAAARPVRLAPPPELPPPPPRRPNPPAVSRSSPRPSPPPPLRPLATGLELWLLLADCESGVRDRTGRIVRGSARWHLDSGNGYYGGFQFAPESWTWVGGAGLPHEASPREQLHRAVELQRRIGWARGWPTCARLLGLAR